jgi:uncharacterized membrane protein
MLQASNRVTINRPRADVFAYLADGANQLTWRSGVVDIALEKGDGIGAVYRQGVKGPFGRRVAADYEITEWEPPAVIGFRAIAGPVRPEGRYELAEADGSTTVTMSLRCAPSGLARLMSPMVNRSMQSEVEALANLKRVLESG